MLSSFTTLHLPNLLGNYEDPVPHIIEHIKKRTMYRVMVNTGYSANSYVYITNDDKILKIVFDFEYPSNTNQEISINLHLYEQPSVFLASPLDIFTVLHQTVDGKKFRHVVFVYKKYDCDMYTCDLEQVSLEDKQEIVSSIAKGLHSLHTMGWFHGDLKPLNICLHKYKPVLIDFGSSEKIDDPEAYHMLKNTWSYFTPIQCCNHLFHDETYNDCVKGLSCNDKISLAWLIKDLIELLKYDRNEKEGLVTQGKSLGECGKRNDLFCFCLLVFTIFGNGYQFFTKDCTFHYHSIQLVKNMNSFLKDRNTYITRALLEASVPISLHSLLRKGLSENELEESFLTEFISFVVENPI
jgi:serine/threonine protein kinase